jgi:hypothetical protein
MARSTVLPWSMKRISQSVLLAGVLASAGSANTMLTLNPVSGALSGQPGQVVGWGFTIQDSQFWVTVVATDFCSSFTANTFPCDSTHPVPHGAYVDFTAFNFVNSQPSSLGGPDMSQQNFNAPSHLGVGSFTIDPGTPTGTLLSGQIVVDYNLFNGDPFNGGVQQGADNFITSNASVLVAALAVPEPGTLLLMAAALALGWRRTHSRS